jgi:hypothetical protein
MLNAKLFGADKFNAGDVVLCVKVDQQPTWRISTVRSGHEQGFDSTGSMSPQNRTSRKHESLERLPLEPLGLAKIPYCGNKLFTRGIEI